MTELSKEQNYAMKQIMNGESVFITGPGGTGKSLFIKYLVNILKNNKKKYQVCALTGCAAILLECGAKTLHSWGGLGLAKGDIHYLSKKISKDKNKSKNWKNIDILIVDEVSMMSEKVFNLIDSIARLCRNNDKPFGGTQLVFCGDFYQLPPVGDNFDISSSNFCFESPLFEQIFKTKIEFTKIFRQSNQTYTKILNQIRIGRISKNTVNILNKYVGRQINHNNGINPTILFPKKKQVEMINQQSMEKLNSESKYFSISKYISDENLSQSEKMRFNQLSEDQINYEIEYLNNNLNFENNLELKIGAQVMCIVNLDLDNKQNPICNGSQGIIENFDNDGFPVVRFYNGSLRTIKPHCWISENYPGIGLKQIPLILSWAITIHKSQGASLEMAQIDIGSDIFECGQTYVALSRIISLDGLYLKSFNPYRIKINLKVINFYNKIKYNNTEKLAVDNENSKESSIWFKYNISSTNNNFSRGKWSLEDDNWLFKNYKNLSVVELSEFLNRSKPSINTRIKQLNDSNNPGYHRLINQQNDIIANDNILGL
jgi:ATP-dependent DNA helicase PIF1